MRGIFGLCIHQHHVKVLAETGCIHAWAVNLLPRKLPQKTVCPKNLIQHHPRPVHLVVVQRDPDAARLAHQLAQQHQARPHHAQPFVVAQHVVTVHGVGAEPLLHDGRVHAVAVAPALVAGVVGRVNEHQIHAARVARQQGLQGVQVVAVDDQVAVQVARTDAFGSVHHQRPVGHGEVVVVDVLFAFEDDFGHGGMGGDQGKAAIIGGHLDFNKKQLLALSE